MSARSRMVPRGGSIPTGHSIALKLTLSRFQHALPAILPTAEFCSGSIRCPASTEIIFFAHSRCTWKKEITSAAMCALSRLYSASCEKLLCLLTSVRSNFISERAISRAPSRCHPRQHRNMRINIIINNDVTFAIVESVQTAGVLCKRSPPRDRHREKQRIESRIVKPLPEVSTGCYQQSLFVISN